MREHAARVAQWDTELVSFKALVAAADREALRPTGLSEELAAQISGAGPRLEALLNEVIGDAATGSAERKSLIGTRAQAELLPYVLLSRNAERWYAKPRGYAGDYLSIAWIYQNEPAGVGRLGAALDRSFLDLAAARAVFNRREVLAQEISRTVAAVTQRPAEITSLACGPAHELFDVYASLDEPARLRANLVDIDREALDHVADTAADVHVADHMRCYAENLVYMAAGRRSVPIAGQDLVYSIGLIDYFPDRFVVALMNLAHTMLRPGGRLILGNFHPRNVSKAFMDHVIDWRLIHRDEADMDRLYQASNFARPCTQVRFEPQRINLFAECVKD